MTSNQAFEKTRSKPRQQAPQRGDKRKSWERRDKRTQGE